ncbi:MAG: hypothetical protein ABIP30_16625 [Ferruginibacter sp.]
MIFKNLKWSILLRVVLIFVSILAASWVLVTGRFIFAIILIPVIVIEAIDLYQFQQKAVDELNTFVESVQYRDFSRHFDVKHAPTELQTLRKGFNQINSTFK